MSLKRLMVYLSICVVLLGFLSFSLLRQSHQKVSTPAIHSSPTIKRLPSSESEAVKNKKTDSGENDQFKLNQEIVAWESSSGGRSNPFGKLPLEDLFSNSGQVEQDSIVIPDSTVPEPVAEYRENIRGIIIGTIPAAYVEAEDGSLRKVRVGDTLLGGQIVSITKDSILIRRGSDTITQKLGE